MAWSTHPHWDHVLWSAELGDAPRYAAPAAVIIAETERDGIVEGVEKSAPGHDLSLIGRLTAAGRLGHPLGRADGPADRARRARAWPRRRVPARQRRPGGRRHVLRHRDTAAGYRRGRSARRLPHRDGAAGGRARRPPGGARPRPRRGRRASSTGGSLWMPPTWMPSRAGSRPTTLGSRIARSGCGSHTTSTCVTSSVSDVTPTGDADDHALGRELLEDARTTPPPLGQPHGCPVSMAGMSFTWSVR